MVSWAEIMVRRRALGASERCQLLQAAGQQLRALLPRADFDEKNLAVL